MTWLLVMVLIHVEGTTTTRVPGFASEAECQRIGRAWLAQANRRDLNTDVALYRCERRGAKN